MPRFAIPGEIPTGLFWLMVRLTGLALIAGGLVGLVKHFVHVLEFGLAALMVLIGWGFLGANAKGEHGNQ